MKKVGTPALVPLRGIGRRISEDRFEKIFIRVLWIGLPPLGTGHRYENPLNNKRENFVRS